MGCPWGNEDTFSVAHSASLAWYFARTTTFELLSPAAQTGRKGSGCDNT